MWTILKRLADAVAFHADVEKPIQVQTKSFNIRDFQQMICKKVPGIAVHL